MVLRYVVAGNGCELAGAYVSKSAVRRCALLYLDSHLMLWH